MERSLFGDVRHSLCHIIKSISSSSIVPLALWTKQKWLKFIHRYVEDARLFKSSMAEGQNRDAFFNVL
jgi:hypothetical protein